ncbi:MAG: excinuclease ABC subunit UvrC [Chloroflexi bacterium]|nr:excinuclease ABC subunit UvrC [Chloroflexota bacterium]
MASELVAAQVKRLPTGPGVYLMKDSKGEILYVGKATNLRSRVRSYFAAGERLTPKIEKMVARVHDIDYFVAPSEQAALILELNLIKQYRPRYNVRLKDDKAFPYLKIDVNEDWPRICITRRWEKDGTRYFGPFASARSVRQTMKLIKRIFPSRSCAKPITGTDRCPCLDYHLRNCLGPCIGAVTREEYANVIKQIILFLEGKQEDILAELKSQMNAAAESLNFEKAAMLRDQIEAIQQVIEGQQIAATVRGEEDVIAFASDMDVACVQVFFVRSNRLVGRESFVLQGVRSEEPSQIMTSFIKQFYASSPYVPPLILLQHPVEEQPVVEKWLQEKRGNKVELQVPARGSKKRLVDIVAENARQGLEQLKIKQMAASSQSEASLVEVQKELQLSAPPVRIEGYDISDIQGTSAVGSMVVFENGLPKPAHYRRFRIKTVSGADDYAMLGEVLRRRFKRVVPTDMPAADTWSVRPDLVLIDGGRGQLNAALIAMRDMGVASIPTASLAKQEEEIFLPEKPEPLRLPRTSPGLQLLQRVRDEAHRFALGYYQKVHKRETFASALDSIPGLGPKRRRLLLRRFGSFRAIQEASLEDLAAAGKLSRRIAQKIKEYALSANA